MIVVTTNELPGYRIEAVFGRVSGVLVHSRPSANVILPSVSIEMPTFTSFVITGQQVATERMAAEATRVGANAVIAARYSSQQLSEYLVEVVSVGTAVVVSPIPAGDPGATTQSGQQAALQGAPAL